MESVLAKKAKRRQKKQHVEKLRRDKIKKSMEELALLIPEARKQMQLGHRLRQTKILQLVVDYIRSSQQEYETFKQYGYRNTSYQACCLCSFCEQRFQKYVHETETFSSSDDANVKLSREPVESSVEKSDTLECNRNCCTKFNMASDEDEERKSKERPEGEIDEVPMETTCKPPLMALKSLCTSICPNVSPGPVGLSSEVPSEDSRSYPRRARSSSWFGSDSTLQQPTSYWVVPQIPLPTTDAQTLLASENQRLWRPWIHDRETDE